MNGCIANWRSWNGISLMVHELCGRYTRMVCLLLKPTLHKWFSHTLWSCPNSMIILYFETGGTYSVAIFQKVQMVPVPWWVAHFMVVVVPHYPVTYQCLHYLQDLPVLFHHQGFCILIYIQCHINLLSWSKCQRCATSCLLIQSSLSSGKYYSSSYSEKNLKF